jgi:pimeloyl-ACP methyl ester carboxylesterase
VVRVIAGTLLVAAGVYAALCALVFLFQRSLIYFPQPRSFGGASSRLELRTPEALLVLTAKARPGTDAVVYFGGNAEDVSASLPELAAAFPDHALYLLHYRGYGGSSGRPSEAALHEDALAVFDHVHAGHARVTLVGRSLGTGVAIRLAAMRPAARLVLVSPYDSIEELAVRQFPFLPVRWLLRDKYESWRYAPQVRAPTTVVVAERDEIIPVASSARLLERFPEGVARWLVVPGVGHNSISDSPDYLPALRGRS